jgi:hypothetical protein
LIAASSLLYWQNQQQRQAEKEPVFIEVICEDWYNTSSPRSIEPIYVLKTISKLGDS